MGRGWLRLLWLPVVLCLLAACGTRVATPTPVLIRIGGSTALRPALALWTAAYTQAHPHIHFDIMQGGSQLGRQWLAQGRIDIAASAWEPDAAPPGVQAVPVAVDGIALIVHPRNPITQTTPAQVQDIYAGHILHWREVGGDDSPIVVLSREDGSGTRDGFQAMVMGGEQVTLAALVLPSDAAMRDYVADHREALGYISTAWLDAGVRALGLDGTWPTPDQVAGGAYPLRRTLYLLAAASPSDDVAGFLAFVRSAAGQAVIAGLYAPAP